MPEPTAPDKRLAILFRPFSLKTLELKNRIVMAPMTRSKSPGGIPGVDVAQYYRRRAEGGVGLIVTEGTFIPHPSAGSDPNVPHLYGDDALAGWKRVVEEVHRADGKILAQLWHMGLLDKGSNGIGPSGLTASGQTLREPMNLPEIDEIIRAYGRAASAAERVGFDGVEIHGAHGYLIDQFFWSKTNLRTDRYGDESSLRTLFAVEVIEEVRRNVSCDYPVSLRFSQWKVADYPAKLVSTPNELARFLEPLAAAGVDIFHCSQRRFWEPEFPGSSLNLAGWTRKLVGKPTISVGSVTLDRDFMTSFSCGDRDTVTGIDELLERMERDEFDLIAVGRSLIMNPDWSAIVQRGALEELRPFERDALKKLV